MRKSRTITLTVLAGGLTLTGCCCLTSLGFGKRDAHTPESSAPRYEPPDHTWFDEDGNPIPEEWKTDDQGNRVPAHGVPHDRYGRPWVHSGGIWAPLLIPVGHSPYRAPARSSSWLTGGSGYRTSGTTTTYRAGSGTGSSSVGSSHSSSAPSGSSVSRGGFGSTGSSSSSSSS